MVRLYFNRRCEKPWSLDHGDGTPETQVEKVHVLAVGNTETNFTETDRENKPCSWVEFPKADFKVCSWGAVIC